MTRSFIRILCLGSILVPAWTQEFRSTITGRVVDSQQAVVQGTRIVCRNLDTGAVAETVSAGDGQYSLPFLVPGPYSLEANVSGFKRYFRERVELAANQRVALDITLEVGALAESVTVTADASMLQTATSSTGQVVTQREIENMPLNGRTPIALAQVAFGVVPTGSGGLGGLMRPFDNSGVSNFSMGGAPGKANDLLIDGAPDAQPSGDVGYNPPVDAVAEVKVETFQMDAAYGHSGGGTVNVVLRGGGNTFHGGLYEFNQVSTLAATPFFTNKASLRKPVTNYNQWGANTSGPVMLPKVLDGRNRVFFYFGYEGIHHGLPNPRTYSVPTPEEKIGDFSKLLAQGSTYQLYDPLTGAQEGSRVRRQPFAGNVIPANRINPVSKNLLQYYGAPNQPGQADGQNNFLANLVEQSDFQNFLGRLDVNAGARHKFFFAFRENGRDTENENLFKNIATGNTSYRRNWGSTFDDVYTFNPTTLLNTRLNWTRYTNGRHVPSEGLDLTTLGFPASVVAAAPIAVMPLVQPDSYAPFNNFNVYDQPYDSFQIFSTVNHVHGRHSLKTGADLRLFRIRAADYAKAPSGTYTFGNNWTRGPLDNSTAAPIGQGLAALLLGLPTGGTLDATPTRSNQSGYYAFFLQDDIRLRPNLTINAGLRYERDLPTTERYDRNVAGFDANTPSPISAAAIAAYAKSPIPELAAANFKVNGGLLFAGPSHRNFFDTGSHNFSPRLGLAWTPGKAAAKTVIRGGVGMFFFSSTLVAVNQTGFGTSTSVVPSLDGYLTPYSTLSNPFPGGYQREQKPGFDTYLGRSVSFYNMNYVNPYSLRWDIDLQHSVGNNLLLEIGYIGNRAERLDVDRPLAIVPASYYSNQPFRDQATIDRMTANVTNPFANLIPGQSMNGSTVQRNQLLQAYPQFTGVTAQAQNDGSSYFHMLQTQVQRRFSRGLQFQANYQFSRLMERRSRLNNFDQDLENRVAAEDHTQRFVLSGSYDLPFGKGKTFGARAPSIVNKAISGWVANTIYVTQTGAPLNWGNVIYFGGDLKLNSHNVDAAFDTSRFDTNSRNTLSWNVRRFPSQFSNLRSDVANNIDFSILKNTQITEKVKLQYRCEFFNLLNRPMFNAPNLSPTSSSFGTITGQANSARAVQMALRLNW